MRLALILATLTVLIINFQNCSPGKPWGAQGGFVQSSTSLGSAIKTYQPAMAVRNPVCMNCHTHINGNFISDFDQSNLAVSIMDPSAADQVGHGAEYLYASNNSDYGSKLIWQTASIAGRIYTPHSALTADFGSTAQAQLQAEQAQTIAQLTGAIGAAYPQVALIASANASPTTIAQYMNTALNGRTPSYRQFLSQAYTDKGDTGAAYPDTPVREVASITIGAPTAAMIRAQIEPGHLYTYYPANAGGVLDGFNTQQGQATFYQNDPGKPLTCDGDLFVDAPVVLMSLNLKTDLGCRIYATGTVFIQSPNAAGGQGITYTGGRQPNLQISSSTGIQLGMGACSAGVLSSGVAGQFADPNTGSLGGRTKLPYGRIDLMPPILADFAKVNGLTLLADASGCQPGADLPARQVAFQHLLLNAPRIDSRYAADFKGVIIADFYMGSHSPVNYGYDPVFNDVAILPRLSESTILDVQTCARTTNVDANLTSCK